MSAFHMLYETIPVFEHVQASVSPIELWETGMLEQAMKVWSERSLSSPYHRDDFAKWRDLGQAELLARKLRE